MYAYPSRVKSLFFCEETFCWFVMNFIVIYNPMSSWFKIKYIQGSRLRIAEFIKIFKVHHSERRYKIRLFINPGEIEPACLCKWRPRCPVVLSNNQEPGLLRHLTIKCPFKHIPYLYCPRGGWRPAAKLALLSYFYNAPKGKVKPSKIKQGSPDT